MNPIGRSISGAVRARPRRAAASLALLSGGLLAVGTAGPARAGFEICNHAFDTVNVAVGYYDGSRGELVSKGWFVFDGYECANIFDEDLEARHYYIYGRSELGGTWSGDAAFCTRAKAFEIVGDGDCARRGYEQTGFFTVDTGDETDWTLNLTDEDSEADDAREEAAGEADDSVAEICDDGGIFYEPEEAIAACDELLDGGGLTADERADVYLSRAFARDDDDEAVADYTESIRLKPAAGTYFFRAGAFRALGREDRAMADLSESISLDPSYSRPHGLRGMIHLDKGRYGPAITELSDAIRLDKGYHVGYLAEYHGYRGIARFRSGDADGAIADLTAAIRLDGKYAAAYEVRGEAHERKGRRDNAIADFRKALELEPGRTASRNGLRRLGAAR